MTMITYIYTHQLEEIARRVWYGKRDKADRLQEMKRSTFEQMGYQDMSTEFPMRSGEWKQVGNNLEMMISYRKWDIPAQIYVRKCTKKTIEDEE